MFELFVPGNTPFLVALGLMLAMAVLEIFSTVLGLAFSELIDSVLPDFDIDLEIDMDAADGAPSSGAIVNLLSWFRIGEVPVVMLFIVFLTGFGLVGLCLQFLCVSIAGFYLPVLLAVAVAFVAAIFLVRICGGLIGKYMPKDETTAVSEKSFYGMTATITMGVAKSGKPAQAKLHDKFGQAHYIMVEPDLEGCEFKAGDKVIVVAQNGAFFKVIEASSEALKDE